MARLSSPPVQEGPRVYRLEVRLTPQQRARGVRVLVAAGAAIVALVAAAVLGWIGAVTLTAGATVVGAAATVAQLWIRGKLEHLREPREYRDAIVLLERGDRAGALDACAKAIARTPDAYSPYTLRGLLLAELGRYEESLGSYRDAIARRPDAWIGHSGAGAALLNLGRLPEAVEMLGKALSLGATTPVPRYQLGLALFLRGEYAGAAEAFGEALSLGLGAPNVELVARSLRAWALERTGSVDLAREEQERARPLRGLEEIGAFRDRLRGANLSPVGRLAAWAVGVDTSNEPPVLAERA